MQVTVAEQDKLKRKLAVEVPLSEVVSAYEEVYARLRANIRIDGFRPGRYPRHLAEKRFQSVMAGEAMQTLVPKYFDQALSELDLRSATEPHFDKLDIDKGRPFRFEVEFEVVPTFALRPSTEFKLTARKPKVSATDIEARIEEIRRSRATLEDKGNAAAEKGDTVTFDFHGTRDGEDFEGGTGINQRVEVGSGQYLPDFDVQFEGIKAGQVKTFELTFPDDYGEASLAGKTVAFEVTAKQVEKKVLPPLDKDFFAQLGGPETLKEFNEHIKSQLLGEQEREVMQGYQNQLTEQIRKQYQFDVPESLIEQQLHEFRHRLSQEDPEALKDAKRLIELSQKERKFIEGNLRLAYVIDALSREYDVKAEKEEVNQRFYMQAYMMRQNPAELLKSPTGHRMLMQIEQGITTGKALERLANEVLNRAGTLTGKQKRAVPGAQRRAGKSKQPKQPEQPEGEASSPSE